ncbi:MAG: TIGR03617 family F420-dependent LLM class oxidoreductase [Alphaproteobacteria bacterium]
MRVTASLPLGDWNKVAPMARAAEAAGFDGLVSSELAHDPFAPLTLATMATERAELSSGIVVCFPRSPMIVAGQAWDLQANSGGRFHLGIGSQVKGHNERRFSTPWTAPVPRMREYIQSLRAIWRAWETGEKLNFEGEHYRFTLMTPDFSPPATGLPMVPVSVAAVGPDMLRLTGRLCDGARLHGFCTRKYIENVVMPKIEEGLAKGGRSRENLEISGGGFIATGATEDQVREKMDWVRYRVAFYGSTRTYWPVFEQHDLIELGAKLHKHSTSGGWDKMAAEVSDDVVRLFAAVGTYRDLAGAIAERYGDAVDQIRMETPEDADMGAIAEVVQDVKKIPAAFKGYDTNWAAAA